MRMLVLQYFSSTMPVCNDCDSRLMVMPSRKVVEHFSMLPDLSQILLCNCRFIDVPIESCGMSSPLRVALQATAPDVLMILLRHGANPNPFDGSSSPVIALMDKLIEYEESGSFPYQLVSCLKILLLALPFIELPFKVWKKFNSFSKHFKSNFIFAATVIWSKEGNFSEKVFFIV